MSGIEIKRRFSQRGIYPILGIHKVLRINGIRRYAAGSSKDEKEGRKIWTILF
jgi:hypothetical protein